MLRVANLVTNPSQEFVNAQREGLMQDGPNGVTSADIRSIKMNYMQHNKNQVNVNGQIITKGSDGKHSQVTLHQT